MKGWKKGKKDRWNRGRKRETVADKDRKTTKELNKDTKMNEQKEGHNQGIKKGRMKERTQHLDNWIGNIVWEYKYFSKIYFQTYQDQKNSLPVYERSVIHSLTSFICKKKCK